MNKSPTIDDPCILLVGPSAYDAAFYSRWLLAAAKAEELWQSINDTDEFEALCTTDIPCLWSGGLQFVISVTNFAGVVGIRPTKEMSEMCKITEFMMLAEIGLFSLDGEYYRFTEPAEEPCVEKVRSAALPLEKLRAAEFELAVERESDHFPTWPAQLSAMPRSRAVQLQEWFNQIDDPTRGRSGSPC